MMVKRGDTNSYIMFHIVSEGYNDGFIALVDYIIKYRKGGKNK